MDIEGPHAPFPMPATTHAPPPKAVGVRVVPLVCLKSNPIHVDARKRDEGERVNKVGPDDVRFLQRQSPGAAVFEMSFDTVVLGFQSSVVYGYTAKELIG